MIPCICYSFYDEGYKIYLRPSLVQAAENMKKTFGTNWDRVERTKLSGGVSTKWSMIPTAFKTMDLALASIKTL